MATPSCRGGGLQRLTQLQLAGALPVAVLMHGGHESRCQRPRTQCLSRLFVESRSWPVLYPGTEEGN